MTALAKSQYYQVSYIIQYRNISQNRKYRRYMINQNQNRSSMRSSSRRQAQKGYSLYHLHAMKSKLQNEQMQAKKFLQKMKQQRNNSEQIGKVVGQQILKVENDGVYFASKLEQQRRKHQALSNLVSHYESLIYSDKKQKYEQMMKTKVINKTSTRNSTLYPFSECNQQSTANVSKFRESQEQDNCLRQLEKDYQQLILRNNTSEYELSKKLDQVRTLRSQRTVFNKVFDQFEQEVFTHQFTYKQLVIQRYSLDQYFLNKIKQFELLETQAQKQYQKVIKNQHKRLQTERIQFLQQFSATKREYSNTNCIRQSQNISNNENYGQDQIRNTDLTQQSDKRIIQTTARRYNKQPQIQKQTRFTMDEYQMNQISSTKISHQNKISNFKTYTITQKYSHSRYNSNNVRRDASDKQIQQFQKIEFQRKVKDVYHDLHVEHCDQIPQLINNLDITIGKLYKDAENLYEQIYKQQKYLQKRSDDTEKCQTARSTNNYVLGGVKLNKQMEQQMRNRENLTTNIENACNEHEKINKEMQNFWSSGLTDLWDSLNSNFDKNDEMYNEQNLIQNMLKLQQILSNVIPPNYQSQAKKQQNLSVIQLAQQVHVNKLQLGGRSKRDTNKSVLSSSFQKQQFSLDTFRSKKVQKMSIPNNKQKTLQDQYDIGRLQQILKDNRTTHNNMTIYTQEELIQIYNHIRTGSTQSMNIKKSNQSYINANTNTL